LTHTDPLAVLHHLSNVDKHRLVHGIDRTVIDPGPAEVDSAQPLEVVEDWRHEGLVAPGQVVRRPTRSPRYGTYGPAEAARRRAGHSRIASDTAG
jgi:hypothetical protein